MHAFFVYHEDDLTKVTHGPHVHQVILVTAMRNYYLGAYAAFKERTNSRFTLSKQHCKNLYTSSMWCYTITNSISSNRTLAPTTSLTTTGLKRQLRLRFIFIFVVRLYLNETGHMAQL